MAYRLSVLWFAVTSKLQVASMADLSLDALRFTAVHFFWAQGNFIRKKAMPDICSTLRSKILKCKLCTSVANQLANNTLIYETFFTYYLCCERRIKGRVHGIPPLPLDMMNVPVCTNFYLSTKCV